MPKYNVEVIPADRKYSEFVYVLPSGKLVKVNPDGRGAPKQSREIEGEIATLVGILKYVPATTPRAKREPKAEAKAEVEVKRITVQGDTKKTELVYSDGTIVVSTGGRPKHTLDGATLVEIRTVVPVKEKGKKGREKLEVITEEVMEGEGIFYVYGGEEYPRASVVPGRGAPPKLYKGKMLEKVIKRVLSKSAPKPVVEKEELIIPLSEKGWKEGMKVRYKGSTKVGTIVKVNEDYLSVTFPGDKFLNPILPHKLEVVG